MTSTFLKYRKNAMSYYKNHVEFNALVHILEGIGIGIFIASPLAFPHPVRWSIIFLGLGLLGHIYAANKKK